MTDIIFIKTEEELNYFKSLKPKAKYNRTKFKIKCSACGNEDVKNLQAILYPFICHKCNLSSAHKTEKYKNNYKTTMISLYGTCNYNNRELAKKTCMERYGGIGNAVKEQHEKQKQTMLEKYGVEFPTQNKDIYEKAKQTKYERYGDSNFNNREKSIKTCNKKYGVDFVMQSQDVKDKAANTKFEHYGSCTYNNRSAAAQTCIKKYGVPHQMQVKEVVDKIHSKYIYDNLKFDSSWELAYYIWLIENNINFEYQPAIKFEYAYNNKIHYYNPDFLVNGELQEIKGLQFFENKDSNGKLINPFDRTQDGLYEAKHQCMLSNNVRILTDTSLFNLIKEFYNIEIDENIIFNKCFGKEFPGTAKWPANHPIWEAFLPGKLSPKTAWNNEKLFKRAIKNMIEIIKTSILEGKYRSFVNRHISAIINIDKNNDILSLILNRFTIAKIAPKVTALDENDLLKIINEAGLDMSSGVYCPMAGFGGIVRAAKKYAEMHGLEPNIEAYDINENFCKWYGWTQRDVLAQVVHTDKVVVVCPPFGKKYEHWKGTPDEMSDIEFTDWVKLIKEHVIAPNYIFIGPETGEGKNKCGLFKRKLGISLYIENDT